MAAIQRLTIASLKNISQVILIENPFSGLLILAGIFISSWQLGTIAAIASLLATATAYFLKADSALTQHGLLGFNSILTGMALYLFMTGPNRWWIAICGALIAVIVTAAFMEMFKESTLPPLTFPFIILTWAMLMMSYRLGTFNLTSALVPQFLSHEKLARISVPDWPEALINGYGQIFFIEHNLSCILILAAVFVSGWRSGFFVIGANLVAIAVAILLGADQVLIGKGLYGYNAILAVMAVSIAMPAAQPKNKPILSGFIAAALTVFITASVSAIMQPYGLPALTLPFVLVTWIMVAARRVLPGL
ncbi:urea transporter [Aciduricibacillus chroicocephali]|uniref:Urea transporter n=1 Tax=Aciduricibacillus chroicocephali TaxID=3054939 RepID=A0ABY9KWL5_9BACI|nr:urea transporter [Bacillaceae bacterium 44XB]